MLVAPRTCGRNDERRMSVAEYKALKERGEQIFDGLRDLPQFGKRLWEPYFRRTFDVYNKLWKFQQEHRGTLEAEYGLQRHEVRLCSTAAARRHVVVTAVCARGRSARSPAGSGSSTTSSTCARATLYADTNA